MARPAEKARAMLNKWVAMREGNDNKVSGGGGGGGGRKQFIRGRRPHLASECEHLADAERYRGQIVREISDLLSKIQNPALGEHTIREMNDDINRLIREKYHWNKRIYALGGLDYNTIERKRRMEEAASAAVGTVGGIDDDGQHWNSSYRYFGAAKTLPGVKELLEREAASRHSSKMKKVDIHKFITPDYFGWRDEEDGVLLELEHMAYKSWKRHNTEMIHEDNNDDDDNDADPSHKTNSTDDHKANVDTYSNTTGYNKRHKWIDNVPDFFQSVPTPEDVSKMLLERKKKDLLEKYRL